MKNKMHPSMNPVPSNTKVIFCTADMLYTEENIYLNISRYNKVLNGLKRNPRARLRALLDGRKKEFEEWFANGNCQLELKDGEYTLKEDANGTNTRS